MRLLFADPGDERVREAARRLAAPRQARPLVLGTSEHLAAFTGSGVEVLDRAAVPNLERLVTRAAERGGTSTAVARRLLERPVNLALALLADGVVDGLVVGVGSHTADVLLAAEMTLGRAGLASSLFVLETPRFREGAPLVFADCAVNPSPTAEQLADIAIGAADAAQSLLGLTPQVALLSFSSHGSANHPDVEKVSQATALARAKRPDLALDGELQADAALEAEVAGHKLGDAGPVAGRANVLVFPDLDAANISYKLVRTLARAEAFGAFLLGYGQPLVKLSRGATAAEIFTTSVLMTRALEAQRRWP